MDKDWVEDAQTSQDKDLLLRELVSRMWDETMSKGEIRMPTLVEARNIAMAAERERRSGSSETAQLLRMQDELTELTQERDGLLKDTRHKQAVIDQLHAKLDQLERFDVRKWIKHPDSWEDDTRFATFTRDDVRRIYEEET